MRQFVLASAAVTWVLSSGAGRVHAGGLEYAGQGSQSLARGGAVAARADDPMVLAHNPAGLAELRGSQFLLNLNLAVFDACVDPAGYYGWGAYLGGQNSELPDPETGERVPLRLGAIDSAAMPPVAVERDYYYGPYDTVCLDQTVTPIPQIAWTRRINERLGIGFGLIFPSVQPSGRWGGRQGTIRNEQGEVRPAATRYMGLSSNNLGIFPTLGVGFRISDVFRIGGAFEWGVIAVNNFTMAAALGGTIPSNDLIAHVKAQDWFVPAITASIHIVPTDSIDLVIAGRWQDDLRATGDIDITTGVFDPAFKSTTTGGIPITSLVQKFPWKLRAGIRYADRFAPRAAGTGREEADYANPDRIHDPLQDERWDVELDVEYQLNSRNDAQVVNYQSGNFLQFVPENPNSPPMTVDFPHPMGPQNTVIEKDWQDQVSVRLGGTLNLLPGVFGLSGGAHYETRGVNPDYMQTDFWPVSRVGLHTGVIVRVAKSIDLVFAYAHIFQETIVVAPPPHRTRGDIDLERRTTGRLYGIDKTVGAALDRAGAGTEVLEAQSQGAPDGEAKLDQNLNRVASDQPPWIINAGRYRSSFDIVSAGVNVHF